jgi:Metal-dependent hydrolases of the beta-lactamase superfamily I
MAKAEGKITITFRGVRGSYPVPGPSTVRYGGNTSCQEVRVGGRLLIFDAGTGIISLGQDMMKADSDRTFALFFSHNHHDHTGGILYFRPAYSPNTIMHIFGPEEEPGTIMDTLERLSTPAAHPVQFARMGMKYTCTVIGDGDIVCWRPGDDSPVLVRSGTELTPDDVVVRVLRNRKHPLGGVLNFRVEYREKSYVYATDVEGDEEKGDPVLAEFARDADLLAHDGQYTSEEYPARRGWGHSTIAMAIQTAEMANARQLAIIHHEPTYDDAKLDAMEKKAKTLFPAVFFAHEGQTIEL